MANRYTQIYYHFIWSTRDRQPLITNEAEEPLHRYIQHKCHELAVFVHALNSMLDHLHLACTLPTNLAIADFIEVIKGSSAHFINHLPNHDLRLYWQTGYGALTFSRRDLPRVIAYIQNQKAHHRNRTLSPEMERCIE
jgi:REP element-mobilizing transposase RayT